MSRTPTIRATWLGQELRNLRDEAGLSAREAGRYLYRDASSVTRMENGEVPVSEEMLHQFMEMCGLKDPHKRADLQLIRKDVAQRGWWDGYSGDIASSLMDRAWMEARASGISAFESSLVPGLLQTPDYAEAVIRALDPEASDEQIRRWVEVRMARQPIVAGHRPVNFRAILDESVLMRPMVAREKMREQLDYIVKASDRSSIEIRVIPVSQGPHAGLSGAFEVYTLVHPYPRVGFVDTSAGELCVEGEAVERLAAAYDRLLECSLDPRASRRLIIAERDKL